MPKPIDKRSKIEPLVEKTGDGTADDVIRANISYVPGAESVQIQIKHWDEVKGDHVKTIEVDADQIASVFNTFMKNLCSNCRPVYRYMESADSYYTKKEGRASSNAYNGATGVNEVDKINELAEKITSAYANGEAISKIGEYKAEQNRLIEEENERINLKGKNIL